MKSTYIIGEIGQNHNGSVKIAKKIIDIIANPVVDKLFKEVLNPINAVKLTKRDLNEELSSSQMMKPYKGTNSFGKTYGEHRAYLELSDEEHFELYKYSREKGLDLIETFCSRQCLSMFKYFKPDKLKVASRDLTNLPLIEALAETGIPIIISTGMGGRKELDDALNLITGHHEDISILHCLSQYPSEYKNINLNTIPYLKKQYPQYSIGYSDHSIGIVMPVVAIAMGAEIIEKHITLDRNMKGTDHQLSLGPDGVYRMVRDIRNTEKAFGNKDIYISDAVRNAQIKLERSIASSREIKAGTIINIKDIHLLSPGDGYKWIDKSKVIGKKALVDIPENEIIYPNMIK